MTGVARKFNIPTNFIGSAGVTRTMDSLLAARAVSEEAAELIKVLSSQWQWMFRTSQPKQEWLTTEVAQRFAIDVTDIKQALVRG